MPVALAESFPTWRAMSTRALESIPQANLAHDSDALQGETFNLITCFRLFLNLEDSNRRLILRALLDHLENDGYLVINNHMNRYSLLGMIAFLLQALRMFPSRVQARPGQRGIIGTMSEMQFRKLLAECGYEIEKVYRKLEEVFGVCQEFK